MSCFCLVLVLVLLREDPDFVRTTRYICFYGCCFMIHAACLRATGH